MMKKFSVSARKERKPYSEAKIVKRTFHIDSNKKLKENRSESKQKKVSTEDRFYSSINHRNGFLSADNGKIKRKSTAKGKSANNEFRIDSKKLDQTVNEIWWKFVIYFNYENTFKLDEASGNFTQEEKNKFLDSKQNKEIDFSLKLQAIFNIYKIRKAPNSFNLISDSEEGSYILKHWKIWIIYIKNLIEKQKLKFSETHEIFNYALEYDSDVHLLFDYFITLAQEFEDEDILDFSENTVPMQFIDLYNKNKEMILMTLKAEENNRNKQIVHKVEDESESDDVTNESHKIMEERVGDYRKDFDSKHQLESSLFGKPNNNESNNMIPLLEDSLARNIDSNIYEEDSNKSKDFQNLIELEENQNDFSFNGKLNSELSRSQIKENYEHIEKSPENSEDCLGTTNLDSTLQIDEDINNESLKSYLVTSSLQTKDDNENNKDFPNPILEESQENESFCSPKSIKDHKIDMSENKSDVITINLLTPLKTNLNDKEIITLTSIGKNRRNDQSLKKLIFGRNFSNDYDDAKLIEKNLRNSGNFAVLELLSKSQEKLGHKYVLTPLKKQICCNIQEYDEAEKDLAEIHKNYPDFIYQPYDDELKAKIDKKI